MGYHVSSTCYIRLLLHLSHVLRSSCQSLKKLNTYRPCDKFFYRSENFVGTNLAERSLMDVFSQGLFLCAQRCCCSALKLAPLMTAGSCVGIFHVWVHTPFSVQIHASKPKTARGTCFEIRIQRIQHSRRHTHMSERCKSANAPTFDRINFSLYHDTICHSLGAV